MEKFKLFIKGYIQTMLFGVEERPKEYIFQEFFFLLHLVNHLQLASFIVSPPAGEIYSDFKLFYSTELISATLIQNFLKDSLTTNVVYTFILLSFAFQIFLVIFFSGSTFSRIWTKGNTTSMGADKTSSWQRFFLSFNELFHWIFTIYPILYLQIACISVSALNCSKRSIFTYTGYCNITPAIYVLSIISLLISFMHSQILIYIMRNHRFYEVNSLKRKYSFISMVNNTIILVVIFFHFFYEIIYSEYFKFFLINVYGVGSILDQLSDFPYRDPVRIPSIWLAFIFEWISIIFTVRLFFTDIQEEGIFYAALLGAPLFACIGESLSSEGQRVAILTYNFSKIIQEKHIIIAVDQFYRMSQNFLKSQEYQLRFIEFVIQHDKNCHNERCYSKPRKYASLNLNDWSDVYKLTLSVVKCIFKTAHQVAYSSAESQRKGFEQLQLQFISFLSEIVNKPLNGYIELRSYQNKNVNQNTLYFKEITQKLASQLEKQILDFQERMSQKYIYLNDRQSGQREFSLQQQWKSQNLYERFLPLLTEIVQEKINHWMNLMNGYPNLNPFQVKTQQLTKLLIQGREMFLRDIGIPESYFESKSFAIRAGGNSNHQTTFNVNLITLRLYSIYFSVVMNDFDRSNYVENMIAELIRNDRQKGSDIIDDLALLSDTTTILLVSMVKQVGKIVNKNPMALSQFFGYSDQRDFIQYQTVKTVHHLLPYEMQDKHKMLFNNYIQTGYSALFTRKIQGFYTDKRGFLQRAFIKIGNLFQEVDDYVLTASILKCPIQNDTLVFDGTGRIVGITSGFFQIFHSISPNLTLQQLIQDGYIFLIMPSIYKILMQLQDQITDMDLTFMTNEKIEMFIPNCLDSLISQFKSSQIGIGTLNDEANLSSWRSWKTQLETTNKKEDYSKQNVEPGTPFINGLPVKLLNKNHIVNCCEWLLTQRDYLEFIEQRVFRSSMTFRGFQIKVLKWPYFVLEIHHGYQIKLTPEEQRSNYFKQINRQLEKSHQLNMLDRGKAVGFETVNQSASFQETNINSRKGQTLSVTSHKQDFKVEHEISEEYGDQSFQADSPKKQKLMLEPDSVEVRIDVPTSIQEPVQVVQQDGLIIPTKRLDDTEIMILSEHFAEIVQEEKPNAIKDHILDEPDDAQGDNRSESKQMDYDGGRGQNEATIKSGNQEDIINVLRREKMKNAEEHQQNKSSQASSNKTSTSKSPFLLIRSIYSVNSVTGGTLRLLVCAVLLILLLFVMLFIEDELIRQDYNTLQTNINFVQYPETLNYYYLKLTMLCWIFLEQDLGIMQYSPYQNFRQKSELMSMRDSLDQQLYDLYTGMITYEQQVLQQKLPFYVINQLSLVKQDLDLTQLIEHVSLHATDQFDFRLGYKNSNQSYRNEMSQVSSDSDTLFFLLNLQSIYTFTQNYVTLLNQNLVYYESKIIEDLALLIGLSLGLVTAIIIFSNYVVMAINDYEQRVLILISRISVTEAENMVAILSQVKSVLEEQSQILWKKLNYNELVYNKSQTYDQKKTMGQLASLKSSKGNSSNTTNYRYSNQHKTSSKSYSNSSLSQRIYDLKLTTRTNQIFLIVVWLIIVGFEVGTILLGYTQVLDLKPTLDLNVQLIRFQIQFDSIIVQGEVLKTQGLVKEAFHKLYGSDFDIDLNTKQINSMFINSFQGFQQNMKEIYDQLSGSNSLQGQQKQQLLQYFEDNLCTFMQDQIPFCQYNIILEKNSSLIVPKQFLQQYKQPWPQDDNQQYISSGIINMVQELSKTIITYFYNDLHQTGQNYSKETIIQFLNSTSHITQFIMFFTDQGKLLTKIGSELLVQNQYKLETAVTTMELYIYISGVLLISLIGLSKYLWLRRIRQRVMLIKMGLTLIPYDVLMEPKTVSVIKLLDHI